MNVKGFQVMLKDVILFLKKDEIVAKCSAFSNKGVGLVRPTGWAMWKTTTGYTSLAASVKLLKRQVFIYDCYKARSQPFSVIVRMESVCDLND